MIKNYMFGFLLLFVSAFQFQAFSQSSPESIIESFFSDYEMKGASVAIDNLYSTNPWTSRIEDAINNIKVQLNRFDKELVGEYYGYELITSKKLGESYILYSYFLKFDRQFLRLTFQFYRPKDNWRLASFQFDDSFSDEIEEAAKAFNLELE